MLKREEERLLPEGLDVSGLSGLSNELKQKFRERQPRSLSQARNIDGMTPAALALILAQAREIESRRAA